MASKWLTDEEVEIEIEKLRTDEDVKLSRLEQRMKYKRRQVLYQLRNHKKRGRELREAGITEEMLKKLELDMEDE